MNVDLKFVELTADVLEMFFIKYVYTRIYVFVFLTEQYDPFHYEKTHPHSTFFYEYQQRSLQR